MNRDKLRNIIQELLNTGCEGTYWDIIQTVGKIS